MNKTAVRKEIQSTILNSEYTTKIQVILANKEAGEDFDTEEKVYDRYALSPIVILGLVRDLSASSLIYREFGLTGIGSKEIFTIDKYYNLLKNSYKLIIDGEYYTVYRAGTGNRSVIRRNQSVGTMTVIITKI